MLEYNNVSSLLTVTSMTELLSNAYISLISSGVAFRKFPSVMLWGAPGVGKSQGIRQIADKITEKTSKRVVITDVRLLLFNPVDLRGIPTSNPSKTLTVWLKPKIFQMDDNPEIVNILFLDEISAAPQSVQAAAYQITLDRKVGEHYLPDNCIVIAAGNRVTDKSVAYSMPKALANRLCHLEIECNSKEWRSWAIKSGINDIVLGFIDCYPEMLMQFDPSNDSLSFPTPRSWEMVSNILNSVCGSISESLPLIEGCIGAAYAFELKKWAELRDALPDANDVFSGNYPEIPVRPELLYAFSARISTLIHTRNSEQELRNAVNFVSSMPHEFKNRIFTDFLQVKSIRKNLSMIFEYDNWFLRSGRDWEDYGIS